jgi:hypothetical protein
VYLQYLGLFPTGATVEDSPAGRTVVAGVMVDEAGRPLSGIVMLEEGKLFRGHFRRGGIVDEEGRFAVEVPQGGRWGLHGYADGHIYHPEAITVVPGKVNGPVALRRALHAHPALAFEEVWTAATLADRMRERAARRVVGPANVLADWRHRFADDVGLFLAAAPGCLMLLGTANPGEGITESRHVPGFDIDEAALPPGVHVLALAALDLLR